MMSPLRKQGSRAKKLDSRFRGNDKCVFRNRNYLLKYYRARSWKCRVKASPIFKTSLIKVYSQKPSKAKLSRYISVWGFGLTQLSVVVREDLHPPYGVTVQIPA